MEFESSPGGWDDISSSDFDDNVALGPPVVFSDEEESTDSEQFDRRFLEQSNPESDSSFYQQSLHQSGRDILAGIPRDTRPPRGPIDSLVESFLLTEMGGVLTVPFTKLGRVDGIWQFGLRKIIIKVGQRTGKPFVDLGANSMLLIDFWAKYEYIEQKKIDGAAAGTQALLSVLSRRT